MDKSVKMVNGIMSRVKTLESRLVNARSMVTPLLSTNQLCAPNGRPSMSGTQSAMSPLQRMRVARARSMRTELRRSTLTGLNHPETIPESSHA